MDTKPLRPARTPAELAPGLHDVRALPDPEFDVLWDSIFVDAELREALLCQALLNFSMRGRVARSVVPLHGIILLTGPPGTGKTSLAKGLASRAASFLKGGLTYMEVEPHSLASSSLGRTQKAVAELFRTTIAERALAGPTIVLLDEVETIVVDRMKLSMDANPIDVHRATDAALVELDHLAESHPNLLILATSNFPQAIDSAFVSRCDAVVTIPLPGAEACREILTSMIRGLGKVYPGLSGLPEDPHFEDAVQACVGLDGRQVRKLGASACTYDRKTALHPERMTVNDLVRAAQQAHGRGGDE